MSEVKTVIMSEVNTVIDIKPDVVESKDNTLDMILFNRLPVSQDCKQMILECAWAKHDKEREDNLDHRTAAEKHLDSFNPIDKDNDITANGKQL
jgi:hypothetical protein